MDRDLPFVWSFGRWFDHLCVDLGYYSMESCVLLRRRKLHLIEAHFVFPNEHSTQPSPGPNVKTGARNSSRARPSSRNDCLKAFRTNSFSAIEGDGGRIEDEFCSRSLTF
jgi:hypothetical protein